MKNIILRSFLFIFFLNPATVLKGQDPYYWKLTDENGLPSQTVYQVLQDHNGLIWIATANGLCSFDGKLIHNYDCSALNDQEILKIQEGPDGKIWGLNLSGQLFRFSGGNIEVINKLGETKIQKLTDFYLFKNKLYFGDFVKIGVSSNLFCYSFENDLTIKVNINLKGMLFSITRVDSNLLLYSRSSFHSFVYLYNPQNNLNVDLVDSIYLTSSKHLCFHKNKILVPLENSKIKIIDLDKRTNLRILQLRSDTKNIIAIGDYIYLILNRGVIKTDFKDKFFYFGDLSINNIFIDREGNFFYSTNQGVLIEPARYQNSSSYLMSTTKVNCFLKTKNGEVLFGDDEGKIYRNNNIIKSGKLRSNAISALVETNKKGVLVFGSDNGLFYNFNNLPVIKTAIKCIYYSTKKIFFGASQIFGIVNEKKYKVIQQLRTYAIAETKDGLIWVGSDKGIYTYDGNKVEPFIDNLSNAHYPYRVTDMKTDADGVLWVATLGHGVVIIKNKKIEKIFNKSNFFSTNTVHCVTFDGECAWIGSDKGVYRYDLKNNNFLNINKYYGLPSDEIVSLYADKKVLLIGTSKGLVSMPYETMKPNLIPPNIHLQHFKVNEIEQDLAQNEFDLGYRQNNLFIEFISYQYRAKGDARYEYRISELDTNWTITDQRYLRYTNLSPGNYHLEIRAINECDIRSDQLIKLHIKIAKPFWLQWWFLLSCIAVVAGAAWFISYTRYQRLQKLKEQELDFKSKIEDLRNQALQAQMNPHFIFNSLNAVQHYLSKNDNSSAIKFLSKFASLIRIVFEFSKKREISLGSELEMLELYLGLEKLRFAENVEVETKVSKELYDRKEAILLPPLLIQPIIENSFRHGIFHKIGLGKISVNFELVHNHHVKCIIEDNGVGRKKAEEMPSWKPLQYSSTGIKNTEERIRFWHHKNETGIEDCFVIEDLYHDGKAIGTRVTLIL